MIDFKKLNKLKIIKVIIFVIPVVIFAWFFGKYFVVAGKIESNYGFNQSPSFVSELSPKSRTQNPEKDLKTNYVYQRLNGEPLYFDVNVSRIFKKAKINLLYANPSQPIVELGIKKSDLEFDYKFQTVQNKFVDNVEKGWKEIRDEDKKIVLLQKGEILEDAEGLSEDNKTDEQVKSIELERIYSYENINDFLNDIPKGKNIGTYKIDLLKNLKIDDYESLDEITEINHYLRGKQKMITYIKEEDLDFKILYHDINRNEGPDRFNVNVYYAGKKIYIDSIEDDNNEGANGVSSHGEYHLQIPGLPEGKYEIELDISDDFFIEQIKTKQKYLIFENRIFLAGNEEYEYEIPEISKAPATIYGIDNNFSMRAFHPSGEQIVTVEGEKLPLSPDNKEYSSVSFEEEIVKEKDDNVEEEIKFRKIYSPKNDLLISGRYFVFDKDHYFDPSFGMSIVPLQSVGSARELDYIIAHIDNYTPPKKKGAWYQKEIEFDVLDPKMYSEDNTISFIISMPAKGSMNNFKIRELKVTLEKDPIWHNFFPRLKNYITAKF